MKYTIVGNHKFDASNLSQRWGTNFSCQSVHRRQLLLFRIGGESPNRAIFTGIYANSSGDSQRCGATIPIRMIEHLRIMSRSSSARRALHCTQLVALDIDFSWDFSDKTAMCMPPLWPHHRDDFVSGIVSPTAIDYICSSTYTVN